MGSSRHLLHTISCIIIIIALAGLPALVASGCATGGQKKERKYRNSSAKTISSIEAARSPEQIDRYAASMIFFKLDRSVDALSIGITAEYTSDIMGTKKIRKTYFIVEKTIDMSHFKLAKSRIHYAELGRNFDTDWSREKELTINSDKTEPFMELDSNSVYRIRVTTFSSEAVDYTITVKADSPVTFLDTID